METGGVHDSAPDLHSLLRRIHRIVVASALVLCIIAVATTYHLFLSTSAFNACYAAASSASPPHAAKQTSTVYGVPVIASQEGTTLIMTVANGGVWRPCVGPGDFGSVIVWKGDPTVPTYVVACQSNGHYTVTPARHILHGEAVMNGC